MDFEKGEYNFKSKEKNNAL